MYNPFLARNEKHSLDGTAGGPGRRIQGANRSGKAS